MVDKFVTELNTTTTVKRTDLIIVETSPSATPETKGITAGDLGKGWIESHIETWTYASATTINVPTDATLLYKKGWGVRLKQGGGYKYFYMTTVAATLLTVKGGSDYTVANAAITDVAVCPNPSAAFGFPAYLNYSPTVGGSITAGNGTAAGRFIVQGSFVKWWSGFTFGSGSSMGSGPATITNPLPLAAAPIDQYIGKALVYDVGSTRFPCYIEISTTVATIYNLGVSGSQVIRGSFTSTVPMTWTTGDKIFVEGEGILA
jgi:hypothetical protein